MRQSLLFLFLFCTSYITASCLHGTSKFRRLAKQSTVNVSSYGYTDLQGPLNWAGLDPHNIACATGKYQSPINLDQSIETVANAPIINIPDVRSAEFENIGTTVKVILNGTTTISGTTFGLQQIHLHTPSEHRINEEYYPLEMHMVHEATNGSGDLAVISVLFQLSESHSTTELLTALTANLDAIATPGTVVNTGMLRFGPLIKHLTTTPLFQYTGSLTTPPCTEGLTFLIAKEPLPLNVAVYNKIKKVLKYNARYTQNKLGTENLLLLSADTMVEKGVYRK